MELGTFAEFEGNGLAFIGNFIGFGKAGFNRGRTGGELRELVLNGARRIEAGARGVHGRREVFRRAFRTINKRFCLDAAYREHCAHQ